MDSLPKNLKLLIKEKCTTIKRNISKSHSSICRFVNDCNNFTIVLIFLSFLYFFVVVLES